MSKIDMHYLANGKLDLVVVLAVFSVTFMLVESTKQSFATILTDTSKCHTTHD
jgi:hypothetical protein